MPYMMYFEYSDNTLYDHILIIFIANTLFIKESVYNNTLHICLENTKYRIPNIKTP